MCASDRDARDLARIVRLRKNTRLRWSRTPLARLAAKFFVMGNWERIGKPHGDAARFSFHPRKVVSTGDGGMLTTKHKELGRQIPFMAPAQHVRERRRAPFLKRASFSKPIRRLGYNYRLTDVQAAIGREQLKRLPELIDRRRELASEYVALLHDIPDLKLPLEPEWARSNWQSYCVRLPANASQKRGHAVHAESGYRDAPGNYVRAS